MILVSIVARLSVNSRVASASAVLRCQQCYRSLSSGTDQQQQFEVEVTITLDKIHSRGLPHPLGDPGPQVVLNAPQMNPKTMIFKRVDDVLGLVLRVDECQDSGQSFARIGARCNCGRILIAELPDCFSA
ncbi:unnamed protein product [Echinostoma caproni]|uniref:Uncharacterized protein n=1 Tax=Echinostoma caproni TaxID=27848 RepID=A0A183AIL6_9TREM|nr:unnamed protein product [Echinostoma caproni]